MKIINGRDIENYGFTPHDSPESAWYVNREVNMGGLRKISKFDNRHGLNRVFSNLDSRWKMILETLNYNTQGKKILELGCGAESGNIESARYDGVFFPWLGRFMHLTKEKTGLEYIGIDSGNLSGEPFSYRKMNLLDKQCIIREFQKGYFDIAVAFMLFNSPELEAMVTGRDKDNASYKSGRALAESIVPQLREVVKPEGVLLWTGGDDRIFDQL
ncbi:MAG: class I SAM-dependent methyltransferase [Nanoarchaeota archaeon]|nr:class I SAM-dependent methyltransferase [Nanoarchaeota archaeon]